jgi:GNAT superfamily N-acetyltransferase
VTDDGAAEFRVADPGSSAARDAMSAYFDELDARFVDGFDPGSALDDASRDFVPPYGLFVLAGPDDAPSACGAITFLDEDRAEVKRMWVAPHARGHGIATRLLTHLESLVAASGRSTVVLDTNGVLHVAIAMYRRHGYQPIGRYNDNPYAQLWFAKSLTLEP